MKSDELRDHILNTYFYFRIGIGILAILKGKGLQFKC